MPLSAPQPNPLPATAGRAKASSISFTTDALRNGGVMLHASHPRHRMRLTIVPSARGFDVHSWSVTQTFRERDAAGEPLWEMPELHACLHGARITTLDEGIAYAKEIAEAEIRRLVIADDLPARRELTRAHLPHLPAAITARQAPRHTAEPWQPYHPICDAFTIVGNVGGPDEYREVCLVNEGDYANPDDEAYANAYLIAAAPEMLAVLALIPQALEDMRDALRDAGFAVPASLEALAEKAPTVLAKARGLP